MSFIVSDSKCAIGEGYTIDKALNERSKRIGYFPQEGCDPQVEAIIKKLRSCSDDSPCKLAACPICVWNFQRTLLRACEKLLGGSEKLYFVTITHPRLWYKRRCLSDFEPRKVVLTLRKQIQRKLPLGVRAFGCVEAEYNNVVRRWVGHVHLIVFGCNRKELEMLRELYSGKTATGGTKLKICRIKHSNRDRTKVITYTCKFRTYFRDRRNENVKNSKYIAQRPSVILHTRHMLFLAHPIERFLFSINLGPRGALKRAAASQIDRKWSTYRP